MKAHTEQANNFTQFAGLFNRCASRSPYVKIQSTCCDAQAGLGLRRATSREHASEVSQQGTGACSV